MRYLTITLLCFASFCGFGQTLINLRTQAKDIDFSEAKSTKPLKVGTTLPATCSVGEVFFKSDAPAGSNLFGCVATDTWSQMAGASQAPEITAGTGLTLIGSTISADLSTLVGLATSNTFSNLNDFSLGQLRFPTAAGAPPAEQCTSSLHVGKVYARADAGAASATAYICSQTAPNVYAWELIQGAAPANNATLSSPLTTKGDLWGYSTTNARIPIGSDGQILTADSSQPNGVKWSPTPGAGPIIDEIYIPAINCWNGGISPGPYINWQNINTVGGGCGSEAAIGVSLSATGTPGGTIRLRLPDTWTGNVDLALWYWEGNGGDGGTNTGFAAETACYRSGSNTAVTYNAAQPFSAATAGPNIFKKLSLSALTMTGCTAGDLMAIRLRRDNTVASNYGSSINLQSINITLRHN